MTEQHKPIHIVHLIWHFSTGGLENGVVNLINQLPDSRFQHSIVTLTGHDDVFVQRIQTNNVRFYCLNKADGHDWGTFSRLNQLLKQLKPDVLHSRNLATLELQLVGWWRNVPLRIHGEHGWDSSDIAGSNKKNQLIRRLFKPFVHQFICLSSEAEHYLTHIIRVKPSRLHRICNGVDTSKYADATPAALPVSDNSDSVLFGSVGRLATVKNQALLLRAFALLLKRHPDYQNRCDLVLVGDGPCRPMLETLCAELKLSKKVLFTGNRADIPAVMQRLDVFILPSLAEGISNTILEAMASGTPVIATAVGGNADLLPAAQLKTNVVPSDDAVAMMQAMQRYLEQPSLLQHDAATVKKHCQQNFSLDTMVSKYRKLYETKRTQS